MRIFLFAKIYSARCIYAVGFSSGCCFVIRSNVSLWAKLSVQNRQEWETQCDAEKHLDIVLFPQKGLFHAKSNESPIGQEGFT